MKAPRLNEVFILNEAMNPTRRQQVEDQLEVVPTIFGTDDGGFEYDDLEAEAKKRGMKEGPGGHYYTWWYDPKEWDEADDIKKLSGKNPDHIIYTGHYDEGYLIAKGARAKRFAEAINDPVKNQRLTGKKASNYGSDDSTEQTFVNDDGSLEASDPNSSDSEFPDLDGQPKKSPSRGNRRRLANMYDIYEDDVKVFGDRASEDEIGEVLGIKKVSYDDNDDLVSVASDDFTDLD